MGRLAGIPGCLFDAPSLQFDGSAEVVSPSVLRSHVEDLIAAFSRLFEQPLCFVPSVTRSRARVSELEDSYQQLELAVRPTPTQRGFT